jgi:putative DNA primase/helicase
MTDLNQIDWTAIAPDAASILLGEPNTALSDKHTRRWGTKGSTALKLATGQFYDHEAGAGGGVAWLVVHRGAGPVKRFLAENGFSDGTISLNRYRAQRITSPKLDETKAEKKKAAHVARIWAEGVPIEGTPAETYLKSRGIDRWPSSVMRYSAGALVFPFRNDAGGVIAIQRIVLDAQGQKLTKKSLGPIGRGQCILPGDGDLHICEGPETGLAVWMTTGAPVMICAGPITANRIGQVNAGPIVLASDAAEAGAQVAKIFANACAAATVAGLTWRSAIPDGAPGFDWNDVLQSRGVDAVRDGLAMGNWVKPQAPVSYPATYAAPTGDVQQARRIVREALRDWGRAALDWTAQTEGEDNPAPVHALRVATGIGKSHAARVQAVAMVKDLRARGDDRCVVIAVPRHDLGDEFVQKLQAQGILAEAWKGRIQPDPAQPGLSMCHRPKDAKAAQKAGVDVGATLCSAGKERCQFFDKCGYQKMMEKRPDVLIVPHAMLWSKPPKAIKPAALIVDEDPTGDVFAGFDAHPYQLTFDDMRGPLLTLAMTDTEKAADLVPVMERISTVLDASSGKVLMQDIRAAFGPDMASIEGARNIPYMARNNRPANPKKEGAELAELLEKVGRVNIAAGKTARLLGMIADAYNAGSDTVPGLTVETARTPDGDGYKVARMKWRRHLHGGWNVPTMVMSATLQPQLLRHVWPQLGPVTTAEAAMPHVKIRQITDSANAKSSLLDGEGGARGRIKRLAYYVEARAFDLGGRSLVVAQKAVVEALTPHLPKHIKAIETAHFNALSGIDRWGDVRGIIIIGRTQPAPSAIEAMAEVLTGRPPEIIEGHWYGKSTAALNMNGTGEGPAIFSQKGDGGDIIEGTDRHPDPIAEALRWSICEAELIQSIGRGRGVNRTAETPLNIDLLTHIPLPCAIEEAGPFKNFEPTPFDLMAARGLVVPDTGAHGAWPMVAAALPDRFPSSDAARKACEACSLGQTRIRHIYGILRVSLYVPGRVRLTGARYAVPVLLRSMDDLHRIDPEAIFEPDRPSAATASMVHMGRADLAIGPEGEPVMSPPPRIETLRAPEPVPLCDDEAEERAAFLEADGMSRRAAERIARAEMTKRQATPRRALVWAMRADSRPQLRPSRSAARYMPSPSGAFALALTSRTVLGVSA